MVESAPAGLAHNLKRLRESRGLSQQRLADASGVPRPTVAHLESGTANPTLSVLMKLAAALGVDLGEMGGVAKSSVRHYPARALPVRTRGKARVRALLPDAPGGLSLERLELSAGARLASRSGGPGTRRYVTCESGEVELSIGDAVWRLQVGEVLSFDGCQGANYANRTRRKAVCYSVTAPGS
ncbi:MAG TPA: XRE family transcriptional regulator [Polyangiaceae bacterium]|nr:XRE family transcriptional regulator [Polyangiaceae bacterium]